MREEKTAEQAAMAYGESFKTGEFFERIRIEAFKAGAAYVQSRTEQLQKENAELKDELKFQAAHFEDENSKLKQENERFRALLKRSLLYVEQSEWLAAIEFEDEIESALGGKETN